MSTGWSLWVLVVLACTKENLGLECLNVDTSKGRVTLQHGQVACAPLLDGETVAADEGKRFITCSNGQVLVQTCPGVLRFQVSSGICQWPRWGDCSLPGVEIEEVQTTASTTIPSPTTATPTTTLPITTTSTTRISTQNTTNSPPNTTTQDIYVVSTLQPLQQTTNLSNQITTVPVGTQTQYTSNLPLETTQNGKNPSIDKDIQYTKDIPTLATTNTQTSTETRYPTTTPRKSTALSPTTATPTTTLPIKTTPTTRISTQNSTDSPPNTTTQDISVVSTLQPLQQTTNLSNQNTTTVPAGTQTQYTSKLPLETTQNGNNPSTDKDIQYTTDIPTHAQTSTKPLATTNTQTSTETRYPTTTPRKSTAQITVTPSTSAAVTTQRLTATSTSTALPTTSTTVVNTKAPSTAYSTTTSSSSSSRSSTIDNGNTSGSNTDTTDPPEYIDPCKWDTCQLPQCFCYGAQPNISLEDTPMFLLLTFDGPMTSELYTNYYEPILVENSYRFFSQNACPFRSTVFLAGAGTDFSSVKTLATSGHEIASGTLTDTLPLGFSKDDYNDTANEIDGLRKRVLQEANSEELHDSIVGFRAPFLKTAFDIQFEVLRDNNFLYDSSISNIETYSTRNPVWPYTMDFGVVECPNPPCPSNNYPGLWEMPLNGWLGEDGQSCNYVDSCSVGAGFFEPREEDWYNLFKNNFETYFYPVKSPMHISLRTSTPTENQPLEQAMVRWLEDTLSTYNDVWLVTHKMVIDWIRDPLTNSQMVARKWGC